MTPSLPITAWREEGARLGWVSPSPAAWPLRLPIARHLRAAWLAWQVKRHYAGWQSLGVCARSGYDEWVLSGILRGFC